MHQLVVELDDLIVGSLHLVRKANLPHNFFFWQWISTRFDKATSTMRTILMSYQNDTCRSNSSG